MLKNKTMVSFDFMFWFFMYIACLCNHYLWTILVGCISSKINEWIHPWIQDTKWMNVIHPFFNHICLYNMYVKLCIIFTLKFMNAMQYKIYFICDISLLWPNVGGTFYENTLPTPIPFPSNNIKLKFYQIFTIGKD